MNQLKPIEYKEQRVLTTVQLAESFETDSDYINRNFNNNKNRYVESKHYFLLESDTLKEFKMTIGKIYGSSIRVNRLYLWTEKGAWMHAKSLNTDRAWEAYEMLVDDYYRVIQSQPQSQAELSPIMAQSLVNQEKQLKHLEQQLSIANERINNLDKVDVMGDEQQRFNKMIRLYANKNGIAYRRAYNDFKGAYNVAYRANITLLHENYKMKNGKCTLPEFLVATNKIIDAIRVADKMLNQTNIA